MFCGGEQKTGVRVADHEVSDTGLWTTLGRELSTEQYTCIILRFFYGNTVEATPTFSLIPSLEVFFDILRNLGLFG